MDYRLILIIFTCVFAIFPIVFFLVSKNEKHIKVVYFILTILYCLVVCVGVFTNIQLNKLITIEFLDNINNLNKTFNFNLFPNTFQDVIINILMFVPLGFLLMPIFKKHAFVKTLLIGISFTIMIEISQLVLPISRNPQLSDIILNSLSCLIGIACFIILKLVSSKLKSKNKKTI